MTRGGVSATNRPTDSDKKRSLNHSKLTGNDQIDLVLDEQWLHGFFHEQ